MVRKTRTRKKNRKRTVKTRKKVYKKNKKLEKNHILINNEILLAKNANAAIIPHAGKDFAGSARAAVFKIFQKGLILRKEKRKRQVDPLIIYLATLHGIDSREKISLMNYMVNNGKSRLDGFWKELSSELGDHIVDERQTLGIKEHSFNWVKKELVDAFPAHTEILVLGVQKGFHDNKKLRKRLVSKITNALNKPGIYLIATTDLIHHGPKYKFNIFDGKIRHPLSDKQREEGEFIDKLVRNNKQLPKIIQDPRKKHLGCGLTAVSIFHDVMRRKKYGGKVVDYYDSFQRQNVKNSRDMMDYYVIPETRPIDFVSYASMVFGKNVKQNQLIEFDIKLAIGLVKTVVQNNIAVFKLMEKMKGMKGNKGNAGNVSAKIRRLQSYFNSFSLPEWSPLYKTRRGIFVGTSIDDKTNTNCSYGRFEKLNQNGVSNPKQAMTANKIVQASSDCLSDAIGRWRKPYPSSPKKGDEASRKHIFYKVELLQSKKKWKRVRSIPDFEKIYNHWEETGMGVHLTLLGERGEKRGSATYLPVVYEENQQWNPRKYLAQLAAKAGSSNPKNDYRQSEIFIYETSSFIWDPKQQKII